MKNVKKVVVGFARRNFGKVAALTAVAGTVGAASADTPNAGVTAITTAITALAPDMSGVVSAAIVIGLIGIGAVAALSLGKRLMR